jgi:autotransporter-associated beta strand protein
VGITKTGPGTWELQPGGVAPNSAPGTSFPTNTYTGPTTINQGILRISGPGGISPFSDLIVNPTGAVRFSVNALDPNNPDLHAHVRRIIVNSNSNPAGGTVAAGSLNASNASTQTIIEPPSGPAITINYQNLVAVADLGGNAVFWLRGAVNGDGGIQYNPGTSTPRTVFGRTAAPMDIGTLNRPFDIGRGISTGSIDFDMASPINGTGGIIKKGDGIMNLRGGASNFSGLCEVQAGTLIIGNTNGAPTGAPPVLVDGGTLDIQNTTQVFGALTLTKGGVKSSTGIYQATSYTANVVGADVGTFNAILGDRTGPSSLTKTGSGLARIHASTTYTGTTTVSDGTLRVAADAAIGPASALVTNGTGVLVYSAARNDAVKAPSISISGSSAIDLNDNDMIVSNATPKSQIETYVRNARNNGAWDGSGLTSSAARSNTSANTNLGVLSGAELDAFGNGTGTFGGLPYVSTDTLVKYTWNGDTNFSGVVNFDDYVRVDVGFNTNLTGWGNGDFNYSGSVNFDDYVLIDVAFNTQAGTLGRAIDYLSGDDRSNAGLDQPGVQKVIEHFGQFGLPYAASFLAAVPEPASFGGLIGIAAASSIAMRRRRSTRQIG